MPAAMVPVGAMLELSPHTWKRLIQLSWPYGGFAQSRVMSLHVRRRHPVQLDDHQTVQGEAVRGEQVPAGPRGQDDTHRREDDALGQAHASVRARRLVCAEGRKGGDACLIRRPVSVHGRTR